MRLWCHVKASFHIWHLTIVIILIVIFSWLRNENLRIHSCSFSSCLGMMLLPLSVPWVISLEVFRGSRTDEAKDHYDVNL